MLDYEVLAGLFTRVDTTAVADCDRSIRTVASARAVETAPAGSVVMVDGGAEEIALSGELFARAAQVRELAGIVVDAGVRDWAYLRTCPLPVYCRYLTPKAGTAQDLGDLGGPIVCGGVTVNTGDVVLADQEGIIVLHPDDALRLVHAAERVKETEARAVRAMEAGGTLSDCLNIQAHQAALLTGEASTLRFLS